MSLEILVTMHYLVQSQCTSIIIEQQMYKTCVYEYTFIELKIPSLVLMRIYMMKRRVLLPWMSVAPAVV